MTAERVTEVVAGVDAAHELARKTVLVGPSLTRVIGCTGCDWEAFHYDPWVNDPVAAHRQHKAEAITAALAPFLADTALGEVERRLRPHAGADAACRTIVREVREGLA